MTTVMRKTGFAVRERLARAAWEFFSDRDADEMTHHFRGGYHQGFIDGVAAGMRDTDDPEPST